MRIYKCYFCSSPVYPGHGIEFARNDSKLFRFCRSKCHKNFKLKRNPRKVKWTKAFRKAHGKDLAVDSTFEFERRRHEPVKYDRELMGTTLKAIKRVTEIKQAREARFWENRMKDNKKKEKAKALDDLKTGIDLIRAPLARAKDEALKQTVAVKAKTTVSNNDAAAAGSSSSAMEE